MMNVRGMSAFGQDADFAGERIKNFTSAEADFVGPQISISAMPASWERAETWTRVNNKRARMTMLLLAAALLLPLPLSVRDQRVRRGAPKRAAAPHGVIFPGQGKALPGTCLGAPEVECRGRKSVKLKLNDIVCALRSAILLPPRFRWPSPCSLRSRSQGGRTGRGDAACPPPRCLRPGGCRCVQLGSPRQLMLLMLRASSTAQ